MTSGILWIFAAAVFFYVFLPVFAAFLQKRFFRRRAETLRRRALVSGVRAVFSGFSGGKILLESCSSGGFLAVDPGNTRFAFAENGILHPLAWRFLFSLPRGCTAFYVPPEPFLNPAKRRASWAAKRPFSRFIRRKGFCLFLDTSPDAVPAPEVTGVQAGGAGKPYFVALGICTEFLLFLFFLGRMEPAAAVLALAAVFGKALPYAPPGLFFTLAGNASAGPKALAAKAGGVVLNCALILLAVRLLSG